MYILLKQQPLGRLLENKSFKNINYSRPASILNKNKQDQQAKKDNNIFENLSTVLMNRQKLQDQIIKSINQKKLTQNDNKQSEFYIEYDLHKFQEDLK